MSSSAASGWPDLRETDRRPINRDTFLHSFRHLFNSLPRASHADADANADADADAAAAAGS